MSAIELPAKTKVDLYAPWATKKSGIPFEIIGDTPKTSTNGMSAIELPTKAKVDLCAL